MNTMHLVLGWDAASYEAASTRCVLANNLPPSSEITPSEYADTDKAS